MQSKLLTVGPDATVLNAVSTMAEAHVSALPVLDTRGAIVGVISATDVLRAEAEADDAEARAALFESTTVGDLMTVRTRTIDMSAEVRDAAQQMLSLEVHRLFVVEDGRLVGVISQTDIVRAVAAQASMEEGAEHRPRLQHNGRRRRKPGKVQPRF
jgi:CBS domain-containing protein